MKKIKNNNYIFFLSLFLILSCSKSDDDIENDIIKMNVSSFFFEGEKWYAESVYSNIELDINNNGVFSKDLFPQFFNCDYDLYYTFEFVENSDFNILKLSSNNSDCDDFDDRLDRLFNFNYYLDIDKPQINFSYNNNHFLGGSDDLFLNLSYMYDIEQYIAKDFSYKLLKFYFTTFYNGESIKVDYVLRANADDKP